MRRVHVCANHNALCCNAANGQTIWRTSFFAAQADVGWNVREPNCFVLRSQISNEETTWLDIIIMIEGVWMDVLSEHGDRGYGWWSARRGLILMSLDFKTNLGWLDVT